MEVGERDQQEIEQNVFFKLWQRRVISTQLHDEAQNVYL
jgi:hypothetical protein